MIKWTGVLTLLLLGTVAISFARKEETLEELVARAEAARPDQQADLYMEAAERERKAALASMKTDRAQEFRGNVQELVKYCEKAQSAAVGSNKHVKNTEIRIRRISSHLKEMKLDADLNDQPAVQTAIDRLEQFRTNLLRKMFGGKSDD
jgi:hypothetical protein